LAQAVAVILHELATNAAKYGALSVVSGRVDLKWQREPGGKLQVRWTEAGGPKVRKSTRSGFGVRVIEGMIAQQNGAAHFHWRASGLVCELTLMTQDQ